ncbi:hypothetical protein [Frankia sp. AgB1.8]|uniref:hypothetical protein n=1 Tax=Frankia sp. AgB1.8 TaxID=2792839 RepID=UPI0019314E75|nr:hypothetical protein [Frankia sp. AgB1.8]MBL7622488.1 hypothetical protein [Frankia sp. AgB1.8]
MSDAVAFNTGLPLAADLRTHLLSQLGAEEEWIGPGPDGTGLLWRHSELGTLLELLPVPDGASAVAVLRVTTPVSTIGDPARARALCQRLNAEITLNRWIAGPWPAIPDRPDPDADEDDEDDEPGDRSSLVDDPTEPTARIEPADSEPPATKARTSPVAEASPEAEPSPEAGTGTEAEASPVAEANPEAGTEAVAETGTSAEAGREPVAPAQPDGLDLSDRLALEAFLDEAADLAPDALYLSCSFVVGRLEQDDDDEDEDDDPDEDSDDEADDTAPGGAALARLAVAAVGDQIATAVAALGDGLHDEVAGVPFVARDSDGEARPGRHRVTRYHDLLHAGAEADNTPLWRGLLAAFDGLRYDQESDGGPVWGAGDGRGFRCEVPFSWGPFFTPEDRPVEVVTAPESAPAGLLTSVVLASRQDPRPEAGEGLLITMRTPVTVRPSDDIAGVLTALNIQDARDPGAAHGVGAWVLRGGAPTWTVFLPNAVMAAGTRTTVTLLREVLLAAAGASMLARRVLLTGEDLTPADRYPIGPASRRPAGLAFAASSTACDEPALALDALYASLVGPDVEWSVLGSAGFDWWPYQGRQRLRVTPRPAPDDRRAGSLRISTEVASKVPASPDVLRLLARRNADDGRSALVLDPVAGTVEAVARVHLGPSLWSPDRSWARLVAVDQLIRADEAATALVGLGGPARGAVPAGSAHPANGPRPSRDILFDALPDIRLGAQEAMNGDDVVRPLVLPITLTSLMAPPHRVTGHEPGRTLTAEWWTRTYDPSGPAARCRSELTVTDHQDLGLGIRVRTVLDYLPGDVDERAAWCNDRNRALLADTAADDLTVVGGWGLDATDAPCLTTWFFPETMLGDHPDEIAGALGRLVRYQQWIVFVSLADSPVAPLADARTVAELAAGLPSLFGAFRAVLDYPAGLSLTAATPLGDDARSETVVVEWTRPVTPPVHEELMSWPRLAEPISEPSRPRLVTRLDAPLDGLRGPLALLLTALAAGSRTWLPDLSVPPDPGRPGAKPLTVPGHLGNAFRDAHVRDALGRLLFDGQIADDGHGTGFLVLAEPLVPGEQGDTQPAGRSEASVTGSLDPADGEASGFGRGADPEFSFTADDEVGLGRRAPATIARLAPPTPGDHPFYGAGTMILDTHLDPGLLRPGDLERLGELSRMGQLDRLGTFDDAGVPSGAGRPADDAELTAALIAISTLAPAQTCGAWIAHEKSGTLAYRICLPPSCLLWPAPEAVGSIVDAAWRVAIAQVRAAAHLLSAQAMSPGA